MSRNKSPVIAHTLQDMFDTYNKDNLTALMRTLKACFAAEDFNVYARRKAEIIAVLVNALNQDKKLKGLLYALSPAEYALLQENVYLPPTQAFLAPEIFRAKYDYEYPELFFGSQFGSVKRGEHPSPLLLMMPLSGSVPLELRARLKHWLKPPRILAPQYIAEPDLTTDFEDIEIQIHGCEPAALHDLFTLLQWVDQGKAKVSPSTGKFTVQTIKALTPLLLDNDYYSQSEDSAVIGSIRAFAWGQMLLAAKWVTINRSQLQLTRKGSQFLQTSPQEGLKHLWQAWLGTTQIHELHRIDTIKGQKSKSRPLTPAAPARQAIGHVLATLEPGQWISLRGFLDYLVASGQNYEIARYPYLLHLGEPEYDNLGEVHSWDYIEGRFARCLLLEYAATLGLIDVALTHPSEAEEGENDGIWRDYGIDFFSRYDGLYALRLTPLGAWILGQSATYMPVTNAQAVLQVMPNDELRLGEALPTSVQLFLERIAKPKSEKVWRLCDKRLLKSLESGLSMSHVLDFLTQAHGGLLPETVQHRLEEIAQRTSAIKAQGYGLLLACESPEIQSLIAKHPRLKKLCLPSGDTHLVIYPGQESVFRQALRKLSYALPLNVTESP